MLQPKLSQLAQRASLFVKTLALILGVDSRRTSIHLW